MERKQILALIKENLTDGNLYCEKAHGISRSL